jgi:hypothetical protein
MCPTRVIPESIMSFLTWRKFLLHLKYETITKARAAMKEGEAKWVKGSFLSALTTRKYTPSHTV